jgi:heat-inducible transcriptional repressor
MQMLEAEKSELTEREKNVLNLVVENFVRSVAPVGSKYIAQNYGLSLSSASIRNVMMELEKQGYITHPHTSAGRIPTDKGYRFYVDSLMRMENLTEIEKVDVLENLNRFSRDISFILEAASQTLAKISNLLGVVLAPRFYDGIFERIELVPVAEKKILAIISIKSGLIKTITMELGKDVPREKLERTANVLNERLYGLTLREIKQTIDVRLKNVEHGDTDFIDVVVDSSKFLFDFTPPADLHIGGTSNIISQPEFFKKEASKDIADLLDDREIMIHILNQEDENESEDFNQSEKLRITIGEENRETMMQHCSLITASYHVGNIFGTVGVLGPTRMHYSKIVGLVDYMAKALTDTLTMGKI